MRIAQINMVPYGSTGKIMLQIAETARKHGHEVRTYSTVPYDRNERVATTPAENHFVWGSEKENRLHYFLGSTLGRNGCYSQQGTKALIADLKAFQPDIVHLHNLHKFCINLPILFQYLKESNVRTVWTLHDCWAMTGQCPYFTMVKCEKWKVGCEHCPQINVYPRSHIDNSKWMYAHKKKWFTGLHDMILVSPSEWLASLVRHSFLKDYPVQVINNGIDLSVFHPTQSDFRKRNKIADDKYLLLGVAFGWGERKGLDVFIELSKRLGEQYQIVLVGTDPNVDAQLPENIISIHKTQNQKELAEIYSTADLFVNPTREENYPTVNMESIACGTPVLTFRAGGSPEIVDDTCGCVVDCDDIDAMENEIRHITVNNPYTKEQCLAKAKSYYMNLKFEEYVKLYEQQKK